MIQNDQELAVTRERISYFLDLLARLRAAVARRNWSNATEPSTGQHHGSLEFLRATAGPQPGQQVEKVRYPFPGNGKLLVVLDHGRISTMPRRRPSRFASSRPGTVPAVRPEAWRDAPRKRLPPTRRPPGGGQTIPTNRRGNFRDGNRPASPRIHINVVRLRNIGYEAAEDDEPVENGVGSQRPTGKSSGDDPLYPVRAPSREPNA